MKRLNLPLIIFHLFATIFFIFSFQKFVGLFYLEIFKLVEKYGISTFLENSKKYGFSADDIAFFSINMSLSSWAAILLAFIISISISIKKNQSIFNSIIVLLIALIMDKLDILNWIIIKNIPNYLINDQITLFLVSAILFLSIGLFIFKSKKLNMIIENRK